MIICYVNYNINVLFLGAGERLTDDEVTQILKFTDTEEDLDGNIKYEGTCQYQVGE